MKSLSLKMASEPVPHGGKLINTMINDNQFENYAMSLCNFAIELDERRVWCHTRGSSASSCKVSQLKSNYMLLTCASDAIEETTALLDIHSRKAY